jgi:nucleotide-binding universal stress UspA family protein
MRTNHHSVVQDFYRARRRADMERLLARLTGRSADLLCYAEVRDLLKTKPSEHLGYQEIPLAAIVGSVERCSDYTRSFLPLKDGDQRRWTGIGEAVAGSKVLPPIRVYQVGEVYFVMDGHHRVSVARQRGQVSLDAYVIEIRSPVPLFLATKPEELASKAEYAGLMERTRLDKTRPDADLRVTGLGQVATIEAQIESHRQFIEVDEGQKVSLEEAAASWYDTVYLPTAGMIRDLALAQSFPGQTETDLYLWVCAHRAALADALGWEVEPEMGAADLLRQFGAPKSVLARTSERILDAVTPDRLLTGPAPGTWRREHRATPRDDCLFGTIVVPVSGRPGDWPAVAQAAEIACREDAQLLGLHVVPSEAERESDRVQATRDEFRRHCEAVGVSGTLTVAVGQVARSVCEHSRLADLIVLALAHPPGQRLLERLRSDFCTLVRHCPTPILAVPGVFSPLSRPLLAYDGGSMSTEALFVATYLAIRGQIPLVVVSVAEDSFDAPAALAKAQAYLEDHGVEASFVEERGPVADAILRTAQERDSDLILMGGYGHLPVRELLFRSTVDQVLRGSRQPVLICR